MRKPIIEKRFITECDICHGICNDYAVNNGTAWCIACIEKENRRLNIELNDFHEMCPSCRPDGTGIMSPENWIRWAKKQLGHTC
jgi:hypothetical protein